MELTKRRNRHTFREIILRSVETGLIVNIHTDCWAAYRGIERYKYTIHIGSGIHTNLIEATWGACKRFGETDDFVHGRPEMCLWKLSSLEERIGGPGIFVEIDESYFFNKNHVGRLLGSLWVFGAVERNDIYREIIYNRSGSENGYTITHYPESY
ncbi:hypothetical protein RF11_05706 [Thelohanellus kitauei]|uniref:ISXO2-like transposase domain-containing protein n=1 Tax=Thelohanellus kitauei TaxID=669202 RepID=A0A0C2MFZ0_THEKT|nr:hypothetical protein RF11_05706 [Thelohanellus kitauei]